jgi:hypothetical protein
MLLVISRFDYAAEREDELIAWLDRVETCNHALIAPPLRVRGEEGALYTLARYRDLAERDAWVADQRRHELVAQLGSIARATKRVYQAEMIEEELI